MWETPPEKLQRAGLEGLLPLLPLTKGADTARDNIVDTMIGALQVTGQEDMLALRYAFASLVYDTKADKQRKLVRRLIILLETAIYK